MKRLSRYLRVTLWLGLASAVPVPHWLGAAALFGGVAPAYAQARPLSLDAAAALVRRVSGGKVLAAETASEGGVTVYRVKVLLPDGHVRIYVVDPESGRVQEL